MDHDHHAGHEPPPSGNGRWKIALAVFAAVAAFFLLTEHRAHLFGLLPYLIILACPLMHLFHGGHGGHGGHGERRPDPTRGDQPRRGRTSEG